MSNIRVNNLFEYGLTSTEAFSPLPGGTGDIIVAGFGGIALKDGSVSPIGIITEQDVRDYNADPLEQALAKAKGSIRIQASLIPGQFEIVPAD